MFLSYNCSLEASNQWKKETLLKFNFDLEVRAIPVPNKKKIDFLLKLIEIVENSLNIEENPFLPLVKRDLFLTYLNLAIESLIDKQTFGSGLEISEEDVPSAWSMQTDYILFADKVLF